MRLSKLSMYFLLNGMIFLFLVFYLGRWLFSSSVEASIIPPFTANTIEVAYLVNGVEYQRKFLRNDVPFGTRTVTIRYLKNRPQSSRPDSFLGIYGEPLGWWLVFLLASSALLLTNNLVFSRHTVFVFHKRFPWISMEEYFPLPPRPWWYRYVQKENKQQDAEGDSRQIS